MKLDGHKLVAAITEEIEYYRKDIESSVKSGWYEKASRHHLKVEGLRQVRQMIELGDFNIE